MSLKFYCYSKCTTCRAAIKSLRDKGRDLNMIDLFDQPPSVEQLWHWLKLSGLPLQKFFNTSGEAYREMNLKDKLATMTEDEKIQLLSSNGRLIKRPIAVDGVKISVGYREAEYVQLWGQ